MSVTTTVASFVIVLQLYLVKAHARPTLMERMAIEIWPNKGIWLLWQASSCLLYIFFRPLAQVSLQYQHSCLSLSPPILCLLQAQLLRPIICCIKDMFPTSWDCTASAPGLLTKLSLNELLYECWICEYKSLIVLVPKPHFALLHYLNIIATLRTLATWPTLHQSRATHSI